MKLLKFTMPVLVVAVLFICMLPTPVNAIDTHLDELNMVDILPSPSYEGQRNFDTVFSNSSKPFGWFDGNPYTVSWRWNASIYDNRFSGYYITVFCTSAIASFQVYLYDSYEVTITDFTRNSNTYSFFVPSNGHNLGHINIIANLGTNVSGCSYGITSCFGVRDTEFDITKMSYRFTYAWYDVGSVTQVVKSYGTRVSLPIDNTYELYDPPKQLDDLTSFFWIPAEIRPLKYAKSIQFLISSPVDILVELALVNADNQISNIFTGSIKEMTSAFKYDNTIQYYEDFYLCTFDLEGMDLGGYSLQLSVTAPSFFTNGADSRAVHITMHACSMTPLVSNVPWYKVYYNWISSDIQSSTDKIVGAIGSLGGAFNGPDYTQDVEDINNSVANKQEQANSINDKMNSVTKPKPADVTTGSPDISGILSGSSAPLVMSTITGGGNGVFVTVLLLVFTFALVGFIFFGKR